jgi:hypothetical protein
MALQNCHVIGSDGDQLQPYFPASFECIDFVGLLGRAIQMQLVVLPLPHQFSPSLAQSGKIIRMLIIMSVTRSRGHGRICNVAISQCAIAPDARCSEPERAQLCGAPAFGYPRRDGQQKDFRGQTIAA